MQIKDGVRAIKRRREKKKYAILKTKRQIGRGRTKKIARQ